MTSDKHLEAIARLLARIVAGKQSTDDDIKEVLVWAYGCDPEEKLPRASTKKTITIEEVMEVYETYPARDIMNKDRACRSSVDKKKIKSLLESGKETKETLIAKIKQELNERSDSGSYLRNLGTLLNNLPDLETQQSLFKPIQSKYR